MRTSSIVSSWIVLDVERQDVREHEHEDTQLRELAHERPGPAKRRHAVRLARCIARWRSRATSVRVPGEAVAGGVSA